MHTLCISALGVFTAWLLVEAQKDNRSEESSREIDRAISSVNCDALKTWEAQCFCNITKTVYQNIRGHKQYRIFFHHSYYPLKEVNKVGANTNRGYRKGSVKGRTQLPTPKGFIKRMVSTGQFMNFSETRFKGVAKEKDGRRG